MSDDEWFEAYASGDDLPEDDSTPDERALVAYASGYTDATGNAAARIREAEFSAWTAYAEGLETGAGLREAVLPTVKPVEKLLPRMSADRQTMEVVAYQEHQGEIEAIVIGRLDRAAATRLALMSTEWLLLWDSEQREYQEERRAEREAGDKLRPPVPVEPDFRRWAPRRRERSITRPGGRR